jgi:hypothetical protein
MHRAVTDEAKSDSGGPIDLHQWLGSGFFAMRQILTPAMRVVN